MKISTTSLDKVYIIEPSVFSDNRGSFIKTIHEPTFQEYGLNTVFPESFYSISHKNVIRGMHFQYPPHDHDKLVYVVRGAILDVVLDLRRESDTFGKYIVAELNERNRHSIYISKGFAHGFLSLEENTIVEYHTTTVQNKTSEGGILYSSFGYDWEDIVPIVSDRDLGFNSFVDFKGLSK